MEVFEWSSSVGERLVFCISWLRYDLEFLAIDQYTSLYSCVFMCSELFSCVGEGSYVLYVCVLRVCTQVALLQWSLEASETSIIDSTLG